MKQAKPILLILAFMIFAAAFALPAPALSADSAETGTPDISLGADALQKKSTVWFGSHNSSYYGSGPVQWRVLSGGSDTDPDPSDRGGGMAPGSATAVSAAGQALLISVPLLEKNLQFSSDRYYKQWAESSLQAWCGALYENWPAGPEKDAVSATTAVERNAYNGNRSFYQTNHNEFLAAPLSGEHFFLLSAREADLLFDGADDRFAYRTDGSLSRWWLRSPIYNSGNYLFEPAGCIYNEGVIGPLSVDDHCDVRPVFNLDLSRVLFCSAAEGGKTVAAEDGTSAGAKGAGVYRIPSGTGNDWKLTLHDSGRDGFASSVSSLAGIAGGSISIPYSGAATGDSEYVSILICDSTGTTALCYGSRKISGARGTADFILPGAADLPAGSYTVRVFSEQRNGGHQSDFASAFVDIPLKVYQLSGAGTKNSPYQIRNSGDWDSLAGLTSDGFDTSGLFFRMTGNFKVYDSVGTSTHPFSGTFDGNGKTLSVTLSNRENSIRSAPFAYISGAEIRNLHVDGDITGAANRASGLVGENGAPSRIVGCRVSANVGGKQLISGFCIGEGQGIAITGCVFDGRLNAETQSGGFISWVTDNGVHAVRDCLFIPNTVSFGTGDGTFYFSSNGSRPAITNSYLFTAFGAEQGPRAYSVTAAEGVSVDFGPETASYGSGVTAYPTGILYSGVFYAGEGETLSLKMSRGTSAGQCVRYAADGGTLTRGAGAEWLLTLPGRDVKITAEVLSIPAFGEADFTLPAGTKAVGANALEKTAAKKVYVPDGCAAIEAGAFRNCAELTLVRLPKNCAVDDAAFAGCANLLAVYAPTGGTSQAWAERSGIAFRAE